MGNFSWIKSDTQLPLINSWNKDNKNYNSDMSKAYLLNPNGNHFYENCYDGYGVFDGKDAYVFWMEMNFPKKCELLSQEEIRHNFFEEDYYDLLYSHKYKPIKITQESTSYESVSASETDEYQGDFSYESSENESSEDDEE